MFKRGAAALDNALSEANYWVNNKFSVTDIIASYTINDARKLEYIEDFPNFKSYLDRLFARKHCTLDQS